MNSHIGQLSWVFSHPFRAQCPWRQRRDWGKQVLVPMLWADECTTGCPNPDAKNYYPGGTGCTDAYGQCLDDGSCKFCTPAPFEGKPGQIVEPIDPDTARGDRSCVTAAEFVTITSTITFKTRSTSGNSLGEQETIETMTRVMTDYVMGARALEANGRPMIAVLNMSTTQDNSTKCGKGALELNQTTIRYKVVYPLSAAPNGPRAEARVKGL